MPNSSHPRPIFSRERWKSLNGTWEFAFSSAEQPNRVQWEGPIEVPFPPESPRSGVHDRTFHPVIWYRRTFDVPAEWRGERLILHFGAVDYRASVWLNGVHLGEHEGGHTPFHFDVTHALGEGPQEIHVRAEDDPLDLSKPRGKQDWQLEPHKIWYPRTTGIWQHVWLEPVAETRVSNVRFTPNVTEFEVDVDVEFHGLQGGEHIEVRLSREATTLAADTWMVTERTARGIRLPRLGFDEFEAFVWTPEHPSLIDVEIVLKREGVELDRVSSYTALRSVEARDGRFFLNGRPYFLRLALDQGYWDEGILTPPDDAALRGDVELAKAMGFNGVRKHQKIEDPRYLYWADRLGLLVWEEMPSPYDFTAHTVRRVTAEWQEVIQRDYNHPCIVAWVCFNESWGVPDLPHDGQQRHFVEAIYHLTKSLDASRPVVGNDGWEHVVTDLLTVHDYSVSPETLTARYGTPEASAATARETLQHGRATVLHDDIHRDQPVILSEFGGIRFHPGQDGWGYQVVEDPEIFLDLYSAMIRALAPRGLAGFCYTQFADTFQEQNGLLFSDRRPKVSLDALKRATRGKE